MTADSGPEAEGDVPGVRQDGPRVVLFDVNETLSDMSPLAESFAAVGAPSHLAGTWFPSLLRDGFALTATGANPSFSELGTVALRDSLRTAQVRDVETAAEHIMSGFTGLPVHPDVVEGIRALHRLNIRLVTLSNGSATVARGLFHRNGITDLFERLLSVEDAPLWKRRKRLTPTLWRPAGARHPR